MAILDELGLVDEALLILSTTKTIHGILAVSVMRGSCRIGDGVSYGFVARYYLYVNRSCVCFGIFFSNKFFRKGS